MKQIENKSTTIKLSEEINANYANLLMTCVNRPIKEGVDLKTMRRDLRIIGIIEAALTNNASTVLNFEDEDFATIVELVENSNWGIVHPDIVAFADYISEQK